MKLGYIERPHLQPIELFCLSKESDFSFEPIINSKGLEVFTPSSDSEIKQAIKFYSGYFLDLFNFETKSNFQAKELTFFGGSFNPWHNGHLACTHLMEKYLGPDHKLIIAPDINPWKNNQSIDLKKRWDLFSNVLKSSNYLVYPDFLFQDQKNPTYNWIKPLSQHREDLKLSLLIGFDSFCSLEKWYESDALLKLLNGIYIASRNDNRMLRELKQAKYQAINPHLTMSFLGHHKYENLSSTQLRQNNHKQK